MESCLPLPSQASLWQPWNVDVKPPASGGANHQEQHGSCLQAPSSRLAAFCSPALSAPMGSDPPTACCFSYTMRKLPRNFVIDYYETSSLCSQPAVVFQTKKGRQVCANPSDAWVQEYMDDLELN
ncbi:C-C motif chemokine 4 isoform X1 [Diceros bicornis minor]|uniref:C-C motif chemokine 4 isoform X1 n=1 Tax=Diceros bicornis minor TaxID=77932 RepID=UPI0026E92ABF|nr:C-C motif chemokine 4 isoform X1 [Diceros bicornis minor]XP_058416393.1 C-C motif chemokine 4 isoform X1 [Diceros bicornis minor]XP_058416394.1 C-C motif chemokine 4 isoform X1 [Diceros bicornis minor]XP_058416395.1 C-C motif chemokine 4 isoform X1 [Diceros bicornis minor]